MEDQPFNQETLLNVLLGYKWTRIMALKFGIDGIRNTEPLILSKKMKS